MATAEFKATMSPSGAAAAGSSNQVGGSGGAVAAIDYTAVAADIAVLVADGASPTQGHVDTLNTDWTALKALIDAATTAGGAVTADVTVFIGSTTNVNTKNKLRTALDAIFRAVQGSNVLAD